MPDYIVRYEKTGNAKYISHLDFLRTFNRVLRRSKIEVAYSQGFNPHPLLSFALPLPVGVTSECEMLEMTLTAERTPGEVKEMLNAVMPDGIRVREVYPKEGKIAKSIRYAVYKVRALPHPSEQVIRGFLDMPEVFMDKKTKSGVKECDIRPDIKEIQWNEDSISMTVSAGSQANLKPDLVMQAIARYTAYQFDDYECHRVSILNGEGQVI